MTPVTDLTDKELTQQWKEIDWNYVKNKVYNLQYRIARAAKNPRIPLFHNELGELTPSS